MSEPFPTDKNLTKILLKNKSTKSPGGSGVSTGNYQNLFDGGMLANNEEFFLYGGVSRPSKATGEVDEDTILVYRAYQYGLDKSLWSAGFTQSKLEDGISPYIAYGGAVSAPSENKAWYFSGLTSPSGGPIHMESAETARASNVSNTLIVLDMEKQLDETWENKTLGGDVKGRANPEVVWVPVGKEGILVVLGGVLYPQWTELSQKSANEDKSVSMDSMLVLRYPNIPCRRRRAPRS